MGNCGQLKNYQLIKNNFSIELAHKIGIIKKSEKGNYYDAFHERIIFPIKNLQNDVIGFSNSKMFDESVNYYSKKKIETTGELVDIIRRAIPAAVRKKATGHPAKRII